MADPVVFFTVSIHGIFDAFWWDKFVVGINVFLCSRNHPREDCPAASLGQHLGIVLNFSLGTPEICL